MRLLRHRPAVSLAAGCVASIGSFDGVHRGHVALLDALLAEARAAGGPAVVICFEPQPREFFARPGLIERLTPLRDKLRWLAATGLDATAVLHFDARLAALSAERFVRDVLLDRLAVRSLWVGADFRFGHRRLGDLELLAQLGARSGFRLSQAATFALHGERVSSTRIRAALVAGELDQAQALLGRPYSLTGRVVQAQRLGRTLGFPTANLAMGRFRVPLSGIFTAWVEGVDAQARPALVYVGDRPVLAGLSQSVEVHLLDFTGDLYGRRLRVEFIQRLRPDQAFADLAALKAQMQRDEAAARAGFAALPVRPCSDSSAPDGWLSVNPGT